MNPPPEKIAALRVERRRLDSGIPHPRNPRIHPPKGSPKSEDIFTRETLAKAQTVRRMKLFSRWKDGEPLREEEISEITDLIDRARAAHQPPTPIPTVAAMVASAPADFAPAAEPSTVKLTTADVARYAVLYKGSAKAWRTMYRWIEKGEKNGEPCPLGEPAKMPGWWSRNMKWSVPAEIEQAALDAARAGPPAPSSEPTSAKPTPSHQIPTPDPTMPATTVKTGDAGSAPVRPGVRLEDIDPEEGDRLRELKQMQVVKFNELKEALELGRDTAVLETKYIKFCETLDKIESRVIERAKKRGLYVLREDVDKDLAANAELLRQTRESMPRRVLEQCPSLTSDQRIEVSAAVTRAMRRDDSILSRLDCLKGEDLLKELAA